MYKFPATEDIWTFDDVRKAGYTVAHAPFEPMESGADGRPVGDGPMPVWVAMGHIATLKEYAKCNKIFLGDMIHHGREYMEEELRITLLFLEMLYRSIHYGVLFPPNSEKYVGYGEFYKAWKVVD